MAVQVETELEHIHPAFTEDAESAPGNIPGQHRRDPLFYDAARCCHPGNLQRGISRGDVPVDVRGAAAR